MCVKLSERAFLFALSPFHIKILKDQKHRFSLLHCPCSQMLSVKLTLYSESSATLTICQVFTQTHCTSLDLTATILQRQSLCQIFDNYDIAWLIACAPLHTFSLLPPPLLPISPPLFSCSPTSSSSSSTSTTTSTTTNDNYNHCNWNFWCYFCYSYCYCATTKLQLLMCVSIPSCWSMQYFLCPCSWKHSAFFYGLFVCSSYFSCRLNFEVALTCSSFVQVYCKQCCGKRTFSFACHYV